MSAKTNYTLLAKNVLFELVETHKDIIESKKNDGKIVEKKKTDMGRNTQGFFLRTWCKCSLCETITSLLEQYEIESKKRRSS